MSSGGFVEDITPESMKGGNFFENLAYDLANITTQYITLGTVGVGKEGVKEGVAVSGVKEITGANAAEEANRMAREQYEEAKAAALKQRQDQMFESGMDQINKSKLAGAARNAAKTNKNFGSSLGDEQDFLGL
jgi:hypothetical protein